MRACERFMLALAMACAGCTGDSTSGNGLTGPSSHAVTTVNQISILDAPSSIPTGRTAALVAVGTYADGSRVDVTHNVTWVSSNTSACAVSRDGVVTATGTGTSTITASIAANTGTASIVCGYLVTLTVHENAPTTNVGISSATATAVEGPLQGQSFTANAQGQIVLPPVTAGHFAIRVEASGYDTQTTTVGTLLHETTVDVALMQPPSVHTEYTIPSGCGPFPPQSQTFTYTGQREGRWRLSVEPPAAAGRDRVVAYITIAAEQTTSTYVDSFFMPLNAERVFPAGPTKVQMSWTCGAASWRVKVDRQP